MQTSSDLKQTSPPADDSPAEDLSRSIDELSARARRLSWLRLVAFAVLVGGLFGLPEPIYPIATSLPALFVFVWALFLHGQLLDRRQALMNRRLLLEESRRRQSDRRRGRSAPAIAAEPAPLDSGLRLYAPEEESHDLGDGFEDDMGLLEGPRNLFGFLDVSSTPFGGRRLRYFLTRTLASPEAIRRRQEAVRELATRHDLRGELLECLLPLREHSFAAIPAFLERPAVFARRRTLRWIAHLLGSAAPLALLGLALWQPLVPIALLLVVINLTVIGMYVKESNPARDRMLVFGPLLRGLVRLEGVLARRRPAAGELQQITSLLSGLRPTAHRLLRYVGLLDLHSYGILFEVLNVLTLWELRVLPGAEKLFQRHRGELEKGIGGLGEVEALLSLACPLAEQEGFTLPEPLGGDEPIVEAHEIGHPLIEGGTVVRNSLQLGGEATVWIITGSNMSGKSTYLKTVGTNLVLAAAGGPVCAASFRWTPLRLHSDINVRDSLDDGKSYFQVEVERVRQIIRAAEASTGVLAIFDELFRGTNSEERLRICRALLRYLRSRGILVLLATHDLSLTQLVSEQREERMANYHLREQVQEGRMTFDYRLRPGPAETRNATRVLEISGYPAEIVEEARRE